jgi:hypothetical protein
MESGRKSKLKKKKKTPTEDDFPEHTPEEIEWLLHVCTCCGFTVSDLSQLSKITSIEIALDDINTLRPVGYFTHIRLLSFCATSLT